ncbi:MAG: hypothetical protein U5L07_03950 [Desulfobacterales bacterium]|nr:hypothetical protein [Desulfobacterales bacterium]
MGTSGRKNGKSAASGGLTSRVIGICLLLLFIFIFEFFFRTWCGVQCIRTGYEITDAMEHQEALLDMKKNLKIELARLTSPQNLGRIAEARFGLETPSPEQVVVMP